MTALIDVVGRSGSAVHAQWLLERMSIHGLRPNVVTLVTSCRIAIALKHDPLLDLVLAAVRGIGGEACAGEGGGRTPGIVLAAAAACAQDAARQDLVLRVKELASSMHIELPPSIPSPSISSEGSAGGVSGASAPPAARWAASLGVRVCPSYTWRMC